jgi:hypothetical protein
MVSCSAILLGPTSGPPGIRSRRSLPSPNLRCLRRSDRVTSQPPDLRPAQTRGLIQRSPNSSPTVESFPAPSRLIAPADTPTIRFRWKAANTITASRSAARMNIPTIAATLKPAPPLCNSTSPTNEPRWNSRPTTATIRLFPQRNPTPSSISQSPSTARLQLRRSAPASRMTLRDFRSKTPRPIPASSRRTPTFC